MTKINHRQAHALPARRTSSAYESAQALELAYLDASLHIQAEQRTLRYGKSTTLSQFVYTQTPRNGGSR